MTSEITYGIVVETGWSHEEATQRTIQALKEEGFGILTEIDVQATLKERRGIDFRPYRILGACNPDLAHQALEAEPQIGLLLPCNVVVQESDNGATVSFLDPGLMVSMTGKEEALSRVAQEARTKLLRVADSLRASS